MSSRPASWHRDDQRGGFVGRSTVFGLAGVVYVLACLLVCGWTWKGLKLRLWPGAYPPITSARVDNQGTLWWNLLLILQFAAVHSLLGREKPKAMFARYLPIAAYRSLYTCATLVSLLVLENSWRPTSQSFAWQTKRFTPFFVLAYVWGVASTIVPTLWVFDHFELLGLRQALDYQSGTNPLGPQGHLAQLYRNYRHPILTGPLIMLWVTPVMTHDTLMWALGITAYMIFSSRVTHSDVAYISNLQETGLWPPRPSRAVGGNTGAK